jgi:hypothetical protein
VRVLSGWVAGEIRRNRWSYGCRITREDGVRHLFRNIRYNSQCQREGRGVGKAGANYRMPDGPERVPGARLCRLWLCLPRHCHYLTIAQINHFRQTKSPCNWMSVFPIWCKDSYFSILHFHHTQQIYITTTHSRATISWQHVSVALLRPSSDQYYTVCAFHGRTLSWSKMSLTSYT